VGKLLTLLQVLLDVLAAGLDLVLRTLKDFDSTCVAFADRSPSSSAFSDLVNDFCAFCASTKLAFFGAMNRAVNDRNIGQ